MKRDLSDEAFMSMFFSRCQRQVFEDDGRIIYYVPIPSKPAKEEESSEISEEEQSVAYA
jgi:hypothetical protein